MTAEIAPYLAEALRREQGAKDWTTIELAARANIHRSHLAEILVGRRSPNVETLERLCRALGQPISRLFLQAERLRAERGG